MMEFRQVLNLNNNELSAFDGDSKNDTSRQTIWIQRRPWRLWCDVEFQYRLEVMDLGWRLDLHQNGEQETANFDAVNHFEFVGFWNLVVSNKTPALKFGGSAVQTKSKQPWKQYLNGNDQIEITKTVGSNTTCATDDTTASLPSLLAEGVLQILW